MAFSGSKQIFLVIAAMLSVALVVFFHVSSGKTGTLVRNSLVADVATAADFQWEPGHEPDDFKAELLASPHWFSQELARLVRGADKRAVLEAAVMSLHVQPFDGEPIRSGLRETWSSISERGEGYCADYSKVFNAMMHEAGIPVREWALGHKDFGSGHTFNEVWLYGQWVFVDAFNGMLIRERDSDELLSVVEFRQRLADGAFDTLAVVKLTDPGSFFQTRDEALGYYARSTDYFYLLWGNNVFSYEANPWVQWAATISRPFERIVAIIAGEFPQIRLLETATNSDAIAQIINLRRLLYAAVLVELMLGLYLLRLLWCRLSQRRAAGGMS